MNSVSKGCKNKSKNVGPKAPDVAKEENIVENLVQAGADLKNYKPDTNKKILDAIKEGDVERVKEMLPNIDWGDANPGIAGKTVDAVRKGDSEMIKTLLHIQEGLDSITGPAPDKEPDYDLDYSPDFM